MATASKGNEEFIALAMVCRGHPQWNNRLEKGSKKRDVSYPGNWKNRS
jgi:hypothetical protein